MLGVDQYGRNIHLVARAWRTYLFCSRQAQRSDESAAHWFARRVRWISLHRCLALGSYLECRDIAYSRDRIRRLVVAILEYLAAQTALVTRLPVLRRR